MPQPAKIAPMSKRSNHNDTPYAPDVAERETADDGFSRGWGAHFQPSEAYVVDCHVHLSDKTKDVAARAVREYFDRLDAWRLRRIIAMDGRPETLEAFSELAREDDRFCWMIWPRHDEPDVDFVDKAIEAGACGVKLHNAPVLTKGDDCKVWLSADWRPVFDHLSAAKLPVLWHVTQRHTASPYTGGGLQSYWTEAWAKGLTCTNQNLLDVFLEVCSRWPDIPFIGAHQLHVGFDKLDELLPKHPNLHIDTSCGCFVRWGDRLYKTDRQRGRKFFCRHAERILFGTDCGIGVEATQEYVFQAFLGHLRYVRQLRLPDEVLQRVSHGNAEQLCKLSALDEKRKGNVRP